MKPYQPRVLHVAWRASGPGGVQRVVRDVARELGSDIDLHIVSVRPPSPDDATLPEHGVTLHSLGYQGRARALPGPRSVVRAWRLAQKIRPQVVHAHSGTALWAIGAVAGSRRARRILEVHDGPGSGRHAAATERAEGLLARRLGFQVVVHSSDVARTVRERWKLETPLVVPLAVQPRRERSEADRRDLRSELGLPADAAVVLAVGRLVPSKRPLDLLRVVAQVPDAHLVVVGDGPCRDDLERLALELGVSDRTHVLGTVGEEQLESAYAGADLFLSASEYEGFGLAHAEAASAGLPVVATAVGGVSDVVRNGGVLVPSGDLAAAVHAVRRILGDDAHARQLGLAGREDALARLVPKRFRSAYRELYRVGGSIAWLKSLPAVSTGPASVSLPYRFDFVRSCGLEPVWTERHREPPFTSWPLRSVVGRLERLGSPFLQTVLLGRQITHTEFALAMFESEGTFLAWCRRVPGPWRRPALGIVSCWLAELLSGMSTRRRAFYASTYANVDRLFYFSANQTEVYRQHLGLRAQQLVPVTFGIDEQSFPFREAPSRPGPVLVVGRDRGRDWATTLRGLTGLGHPVRILCRPADLAAQEIPPGVDVVGYVDPHTYRQEVQRASLVVVATRDLAYPTGQTVVLEALATGRPVVATATRALVEYLPTAATVHIGVGDDVGLHEGVVSLLADDERRRVMGAEGRAAVEARFTARHMWARITESLIDAFDSRNRN